jgi:hypothetical protein
MLTMKKLLMAGVAAVGVTTFAPLVPAQAAPCVAGSSVTCNACLMGSQEACAALGNPPPLDNPATPPSFFPCGGTGLPPVAGPPTPGSPCRR